MGTRQAGRLGSADSIIRRESSSIAAAVLVDLGARDARRVRMERIGLAVLTSYFDAAGHNADTHAVTVGGFTSDVRAWSRFARRWREALDRHKIKDFRMSAFVAGSIGFERFKSRPDLQTPVLEELVGIIRKNVRFSFATTVLSDDWRAVNVDYRLRECRLTPYAVAGFSVMNKTIRWLGKPGKDRKFTEFVFEEGDAGQADFKWLIDEVVKLRPDPLTAIRPQFRPKSLLPLQSADFAVWEQRSFVRKRLEGKTYEELRQSLQTLLMIPNDWGVMNRPQIAEWAVRIGAPKRSESWNRKTWRPRFPS